MSGVLVASLKGMVFLIAQYSLSALKSTVFLFTFFTTKGHVAVTCSNDKIINCSQEGTCIRPEKLLLLVSL